MKSEGIVEKLQSKMWYIKTSNNVTLSEDAQPAVNARYILGIKLTETDHLMLHPNHAIQQSSKSIHIFITDT